MPYFPCLRLPWQCHVPSHHVTLLSSCCQLSGVRIPHSMGNLKAKVTLARQWLLLYLFPSKAPGASPKHGMLIFNVGGGGLSSTVIKSGPWPNPSPGMVGMRGTDDEDLEFFLVLWRLQSPPGLCWKADAPLIHTCCRHWLFLVSDRKSSGLSDVAWRISICWRKKAAQMFNKSPRWRRSSVRR